MCKKQHVFGCWKRITEGLDITDVGVTCDMTEKPQTQTDDKSVEARCFSSLITAPLYIATSFSVSGLRGGDWTSKSRRVKP